MNTKNQTVTGARNAERKQNLETGSDAHAEASQSNRTDNPRFVIHCRIVDHLTGFVQSCAAVETVSQACRFFREHGYDFSDAVGKDIADHATFEIVI